jgi:hypothetical protein
VAPPCTSVTTGNSMSLCSIIAPGMHASAFLQAFHFASIRYIQRNTSRCKGALRAFLKKAGAGGRADHGSQQAAEGGRERERTRPAATHPRCWKNVLLLPILPLYLVAILVIYFVVILLAVCAPSFRWLPICLIAIYSKAVRPVKAVRSVTDCRCFSNVPLLLLAIWLFSAQ